MHAYGIYAQVVDVSVSVNAKLCFYSVWVQALNRFFSVNIFRTECLPQLSSVNTSVRFVSLALLFLKSFAASFHTFPFLVKRFVVDNAYGIFAFFKTFPASFFCLRNRSFPHSNEQWTESRSVGTKIQEMYENVHSNLVLVLLYKLILA